MRAELEKLIQQHTQPLVEKIESLCQETEDLRRRLRLMNRLGVVSEIHENNRLIKVKYGELETPFIKWFALASGRVSHYRLPSVDEQTLLVNFGGGDSGKQFIALVGIDSMQFPIPAKSPEQVITNYGENLSLIWDMAASSLTIRATELVKIETKLLQTTQDLQVDNNAAVTGNIEAGKNITAGQNVSDSKSSMDDMRDVYNGHTHNRSVPPPADRME
jgi:phage baseplate assembly protein V